jgi:serine/threonine-protein kinase
MKAITTIDELTAALRQIQLLTTPQFEQYERDAKAQLQDVKRLSSLLVERGFLTRYQVDCILKFEGPKLILGNYVIVDKLGEGGMGVVYKAWQRRLNRFVAIKTIRERVSRNDERLVKRFRREAELAAQLLHPNIVVVHDLDQDGDTHFIVMEYVEGVDLARHVHEVGPLPVAQACDYIRQAAIGLQHAHEHDLIHRDIKPSNLLLASGNKSSSIIRRSSQAMDRDAGILQGATHRIERLQPNRPAPGAASNRLPGSGVGVIKLLDLGLACLNGSLQESGQSSLTVKGSFLGTPDYVAPEQGRNASSVDGRADLYSLGCTLYFLLTGQPPFADGTSMDKLMRHQYDAPPKLDETRPDVPASVRRIVKKLMAKKPEDRYQTAQELADALYEAQQEMDSAVKAPPSPPPDAAPAKSDGDGSSVKPLPKVKREKHKHASPTIQESVTNLGAEARKWNSLKAHQGCILSLAFSADSKLLASCGVDDTLRIWEIGDTPSERSTIRGITIGEAHALCFSHDGRHLFGAATNTSGYLFRCHWIMPSHDKFQVFRGPETPIAALAVAADGEHFISAGGKKVVLWNVDAKKLWQRTDMEGHRADFKSATFAGDNKLIAAGDNDGVVWIWRIGRLWTKPVNVFVGHQGSVNTVAFSPDSKEVASGGLDRRVLVWDACGPSENPIEIYEGLNSHVRQVIFLDGGTKLLAAGQDGHCLIWDRKTRSPLFQMSLGQVFAVQVAASPDGQILAVATNDGTISFYRIDAGGGTPSPKESAKSNRVKTSKSDSSEQTKRTRVVPAKTTDGK